MPLLLLDLDNTLVDRDAAFRLAATGFVADHALPDAEVDWIMAVDAGGHAPRREVAAAMRARYEDEVPADVPTEDVRALLRGGAAEYVVMEEATRAALRRATAAGWTSVVVTNGGAASQERKLRVSGLDKEVAGWVISGALGFAKPDPRIFAAAAALVEATLDGGWMVGDTPQADIEGAVGSGLASVWLSRGRSWPDGLAYRPTHTAASLPAALDHIMSGRS